MDLKDWLKRQDISRTPGEWPLSVDGIRYTAETIWRVPLLRYYTDHSVAHSDRIIENLSLLTEGLINNSQITPTEVFILLASAYLHDIGMLDERFNACDLEQIRIHHHELTRKLVMDGTVKLGLELVPNEIIYLIALVSEAHRETNLGENEYDEFEYGGTTIRPRLLAALLRLADELDIDHRRVDLQKIKIMNIPVESVFHWYLCYYVAGVSIKNGSIKISYQFPEDCKNYKEIVEPLIRGKIQEEYTLLETILWDYKCMVRMDNNYDMRLIPGLYRMSTEVIDVAREKNKKKHTEKILQHKKKIKYFDTITVGALESTE